jgi:MFS family permease
VIDRIIILVIVNVLFFWKTLKFKYVSDDLSVYMKTKDKKYKPFERICKQLLGEIRVSEKQDHAITLVLHALCSVFLYTAFGCNDVSFLAALLFTVNPANNQGSVWIAGRGYVYPTLFFLMAMTFLYAAPVFLYMATYFHAGYLALVMFVFSPLWWFVFFMPIIWILGWKNFREAVTRKINQEMFSEDKKVHPKKLILFFKTLGFYFSLTLVPFRNTFYHSFLQSAAGNDIMKKRAYKMDRFFFIGITVFSLFAWYILTHCNMISFAMVWFIITIAPFCNLFRLSQEIAERYMYLPCVGIMYLLATFTAEYPLLYTAFLSMYATKLWFYMDAYRDDYFIAEVSCLNSPDSWYSWHIRAMKRWESGEAREALTLWTMAKMISPKEFKVLFNIGTVLTACGNKNDSKAFVEEAMKNVPEGQEDMANKIYENYLKGEMCVLL